MLKERKRQLIFNHSVYSYFPLELESRVDSTSLHNLLFTSPISRVFVHVKVRCHPPDRLCLHRNLCLGNTHNKNLYGQCLLHVCLGKNKKLHTKLLMQYDHNYVKKVGKILEGNISKR